MAEYPSTSWMRVGCVKAPNRPYFPRTGAGSETVGNGTDYAASVTSGLIKKTIGSFRIVKGVTAESDPSQGGANIYSLQLNTNFMNTKRCQGISGCLTWQQFIYSSGEESVFMQYWLINYGTKCPNKDWIFVSGSCFMNSTAVFAPQLAITDLSTFKVTGAANAARDTVVFTGESIAYSTTGSDAIVGVSTGWTQSEFNIVGDGNSSEALFNAGSLIQVWTHVYNGTTDAPTCAKNAGTTAETNNLTLGACVTSGGANPYILFNEKN